MTKRARWLILMGFVLPGSAQLLSGNRRLGRFGLISTVLLIAGALIALLGFLLMRVQTLTILTNGFVLLVLQWVLFGYAVLWIVLGFNTLRLTRIVRVHRNWKLPVAVLSVVLTVVPAVGAAWAGSAVAAGRGVLSNLFASAPAVEPIDGRYNILLLGTDAGQDREGMRPDSISLVSVDAQTGQSVIIGIPRELINMPFPESSPMHPVHPNGFCVGPNAFGEGGGCLTNGYLNALFAEVEQADEIVEVEGLPEEFAQFYEGLYPDAAAKGTSPGIEAIKDAVQGATGLDPQFHVLVNMDAFSNLIDALGGITVNVTEELPIGGDQDGNNVEGWIMPGEQGMDGYTAQWYARSRYGSADGDYARMRRQREIQAAILAQMNPENVLLRFQDIASAGTQLVETDIPESMLGRFVDLASKARAFTPVNVELAPPEVDPEYPDFSAIQQLVAAGVAEASPPETN
ncbi:LCP family protein [Leucobacter insecticola]|nr:LCP family protein [Leucobacter insecticola]